jgi:hypothetical protein
MEINRLKFQFELSPEDLLAIRGAIARWKNDQSIVDQFSGAFLYGKFDAWREFVDTEWGDWDISEYDHDIGCRYWIQLAIENSAPRTADTLQSCVKADDGKFMKIMRPKVKPKVFQISAFRGQPYFWEVNTIHPEL